MYFAFLLSVLIAIPASAHPGKTDRDGGHKCYKECAEWDLYYAEYHLHDKDGRAVKVVRKKRVKAAPEAVQVEEQSAGTADRPAKATISPHVVAAAGVVVEDDNLSLPWILLMLFLLLFFVVRRNRRKNPGTGQGIISR